MEKIEEIVKLIDEQEKKQTRNVLIKYLKKWPWFALFCVMGIALGYFIFINSPNKYTVKSRILIKSKEKSLSNVLAFDNQGVPQGKKSNIENQIGILQSYTLYKRALDNLDWNTTWYKKELLHNKELYNSDPFELIVPPNALNAENIVLEIKALNDKEYFLQAEGVTFLNGYNQFVDIEQTVRFGKPFINEFFNFTINKGYASKDDIYYLKFNDLHALTRNYLSKTKIEIEDINSDFITITVEGENIQKEADFINELNNVFIAFGIENENQSSENSVNFIEAQLDRIKSSLAVAEDRYSDYRKNNQVVNLGQEAQLIYSKMEEIENEQYFTQLQIDYYKDLQQYLDDSQKIEEMVNPTVVGITNPGLNDLLKKLMELYQRRGVLSFSVQDKNPQIKLLENEIQLTRDALDETLKNQLKVTQTKMESLNQRYYSIQERVQKLPETEKKLIGIQREFNLNNELYTYLLQKKAEASISKASIAPDVQIIDEAIPEAAVKTGPSLIKNVLAGVIGGMSIPFIFITVIGFFNTKIESRQEIEHGSTLPVLDGIIQHKYKVKLPVVHYPRSGIAESFRGLKSNLNAILEQPGSKVVSVNSLVPGEGKSFISSNFSAILAKRSTRVLLIGADLHNPILHKFLDVDESYGLSDYLADEKGIDEIISTTSIDSLSFIQAGSLTKNPSDLIDNSKFESLIDRCRKMFDYIIIDNAPLLLVPDAVLTSRFSDVSLFILRMNYSNKEQIKQINKLVDFNKIKRAAVLINEAPDRGYGYSNKYWKKGYGEYKNKMNIA